MEPSRRGEVCPGCVSVKKKSVFRSSHSEGIKDTAGLGSQGQPSTCELKMGVTKNRGN